MSKKTRTREPDIMDRTRAAVCYVNSRAGSERIAMFAFLSLMHPEIPLEKRLRMANELANERVG